MRVKIWTIVNYSNMKHLMALLYAAAPRFSVAFMLFKCSSLKRDRKSCAVCNYQFSVIIEPKIYCITPLEFVHCFMNACIQSRQSVSWSCFVFNWSLCILACSTVHHCLRNLFGAERKRVNSFNAEYFNYEWIKHKAPKFMKRVEKKKRNTQKIPRK